MKGFFPERWKKVENANWETLWPDRSFFHDTRAFLEFFFSLFMLMGSVHHLILSLKLLDCFRYAHEDSNIWKGSFLDNFTVLLGVIIKFK